MPDYLHDENIAHFERLVADSVANPSRDEKRHAMLLRLLAEKKRSATIQTRSKQALSHETQIERVSDAVARIQIHDCKSGSIRRCSG